MSPTVPDTKTDHIQPQCAGNVYARANALPFMPHTDALALAENVEADTADKHSTTVMGGEDHCSSLHDAADALAEHVRRHLEVQRAQRVVKEYSL